MFIKGFSKDADLVSIQKTVENNSDIMPYLPACHILTGCDTAPKIFWIGKKRDITTGRQLPLVKFMQSSSTETEYMAEAKDFVACCYGCKKLSSSENRIIIWERKPQQKR